MEEPAPPPNIEEYRRGLFKRLEEHVRSTTPVAWTLSFLLSIIGTVMCATVGLQGGVELFGIAGGIAGLLLGVVVGVAASKCANRLSVKRLFRRVKRSTDAELWEMVDQRFGWTLETTLALAQLAARGHDVSGALPRIRAALRRALWPFGWTAGCGIAVPRRYDGSREPR